MVCMERSWTGSVSIYQPLKRDRKVRPQSRKGDGQAANLAPAQILEGFSEEDPNTQHPGRVSVRPTFDDVRVFQWQLPQQLVFAGRVNDAGCRVPVGSQGELWPGQGSGTHGGKTAPHFLRPPCQALTTHRLMELRRREPDFRFRVVQTMRSVNRKRDRSFLPPTAFCGARGRIQAQRPTLLPTVPKGTARPREG